MSDFAADGGWLASAEAWIRLAPEHDTRTLLLDPVMLAECGDLQGKAVLDLGCGEGRFSRLLAARGARPCGIDTIARMVQAAVDAGGPDERYLIAAGEQLPFDSQTFDIVVVYLTLVDITAFRAAIEEAARVLCPGGRFIIANVSNLTSSAGNPVVDEHGHFLYYAVDRYLEERPLMLEFGGVRVRNWHRPLAAYMDAYLSAGLILRRYLEPEPQDASLRSNPRYESWFRVPAFDVMVWQKRSPTSN